jgi:putative transposase
MQTRQVQFKLYPTSAQKLELENWNVLHCRLYNACLEQRITMYRQRGVSVCYYDQQNELPALKKEFPEYIPLGSQALQETVRRVDRAFQAFFARVKRGETPGFPRFKSSKNYSGFCYPAKAGWKFELGSNGKHGKLTLSKLGTLKARGVPRQWGEARQVILSKHSGSWYATITIRCEVTRQAGNLQAGMDLGLEHVVSLSDGTQIGNPRFLKTSATQLATLQRELSRRSQYGSNWKRTKSKIANLHAKIANQRDDFQHQISSRLVKTYGILATEELNIQNMTAHGGAYKKGLNRSILDVGMAGLLQKLEYKVSETGTGRFWKVPTRKVKPSQTCPLCGHQEKKLLSERVHLCKNCGYTGNRDVVAAQVMLEWALENYGQELACGGGPAREVLLLGQDNGTAVLGHPREPRNPDYSEA